MSAEPDGAGPLAGLSVLEVGTGVGAAFAGLLLAQLGATVVAWRSEPTGATTLRERSESLYLDAGKILRRGEDEALLLEAVKQCEVVLAGADPAGPAEVAELRLRYASWREYNPRLIYVAVTPFGTDGPASGWTGGDANAQSLSGWTSIIGMAGAAPLMMNYGIGAMQAGLCAAAAGMGAVLARGDLERAEFVDISETDVLTTSIRQYAGSYRRSRIPLVRAGLRAPGSSGRYPHTVWPCQDGQIMIILRTDSEWERFVQMLGDPPWADQERYRDFRAMAIEYPDEVDALIEPWMRARTMGEIEALATHHKVPLAPVRARDHVLEDEQLAFRNFFVNVEAQGDVARVPGSAAIIVNAGATSTS